MDIYTTYRAVQELWSANVRVAVDTNGFVQWIIWTRTF